MRSVRTLALSAFMTVAALSAGAQSPVVDNPDNHPYFGVRVSGDISVPGKVNGARLYHNDAGFSVSAVYNMPVVANLFFEPGVGLYYDTFNLGNIVIGTDDGLSIKEIKPKYSQFGIRIPLTLGYRFDFWEGGGVSLLTGPEATIGLSGRIHCKYLDELNMPDDMYGDENGFRRFNLSWGIGTSVDAGRFTIGCMGYFGLLNTIKEKTVMDYASFISTGRKFHQNNVRIFIGYNF